MDVRNGPPGWPIKGYSNLSRLGGATIVTANTLLLYANAIPYAVQFSKISFYVGVADAAHNSDVGLYNSLGALVANIGAQALAAGGIQDIATVQGLQVINAGLYFFAVTSAASVLGIQSDGAYMALYGNAAFGSSAGGALPATITPPALAPSQTLLAFNLD
jgi:hypothetical protein